jgi:hypothetical protein
VIELGENCQEFKAAGQKKRGAWQTHKRPSHSRIKVNRTSLDHLLLDRDVEKAKTIIIPFKAVRQSRFQIILISILKDAGGACFSLRSAFSPLFGMASGFTYGNSLSCKSGLT